jgi:hypothetical protein
MGATLHSSSSATGVQSLCIPRARKPIPQNRHTCSIWPEGNVPRSMCAACHRLAALRFQLKHAYTHVPFPWSLSSSPGIASFSGGLRMGTGNGSYVHASIAAAQKVRTRRNRAHGSKHSRTVAAPALLTLSRARSGSNSNSDRTYRCQRTIRPITLEPGTPNL